MNSSEMGKKGGTMRARKLSKKRRREIARLGGIANAKKRKKNLTAKKKGME